MLDVLVHIDAEDIAYVYDWRLEQERWLVAEKGQGMSDEAVRKFVDGCTFCLCCDFFMSHTAALRGMDADVRRYAGL
jgi:D-glycerate 3-kinase